MVSIAWLPTYLIILAQPTVVIASLCLRLASLSSTSLLPADLVALAQPAVVVLPVTVATTLPLSVKAETLLASSFRPMTCSFCPILALILVCVSPELVLGIHFELISMSGCSTAAMFFTLCLHPGVFATIQLILLWSHPSYGSNFITVMAKNLAFGAPTGCPLVFDFYFNRFIPTRDRVSILNI